MSFQRRLNRKTRRSLLTQSIQGQSIQGDKELRKLILEVLSSLADERGMVEISDEDLETFIRYRQLGYAIKAIRCDCGARITILENEHAEDKNMQLVFVHQEPECEEWRPTMAALGVPER